MGAWNWSGIVRAMTLAVALVGATGARAEPPSPGRATIGDITFHYGPNSWSIMPVGEGLVARCLQSDCYGAVFDITLHEGEEQCSEDEVVKAAERLFPATGRAYANTLRAGKFGLVLAQRHVGPELSSPSYVYACLGWQGDEYRFTIRPETVGTATWVGGALHYLVHLATAPPGRIETVTVGDVDFTVPTETWRISEVKPGEHVMLTCRVPACRKEGAILTLSSRADGGPCSDPVRPNIYSGDVETSFVSGTEPNSLRFTLTSVYLGCRNYVPPNVAACAVHKGRSYHIGTMGGAGCRSSYWTVPDDALIDLMTSARIRP